MSYILEALKKAQAERQLGSAPTIHAPAVAVAPAANPARVPLLAGAAAAVVLAAVALFVWHRQGAPVTAGAPAVRIVDAAGVTAAGARGSATGIPPASAGLGNGAVHASAPGGVSAGAATGNVAGQASRADGALAASPSLGAVRASAPPPVAGAVAQSAPAPAAAMSAPAGQVALVGRADPPPPAPVRVAQPVSPAPVRAAPPAAVASISPAAAAAPAQPVVAPASGDEALGGVNTLPDAIRSSVPKVAFGGYMYSPNPADRLVLVDNVLRREGEEVAPGLVLEKLLPKGAVLNYRGYRYRVAF